MVKVLKLCALGRLSMLKYVLSIIMVGGLVSASDLNVVDQAYDIATQIEDNYDQLSGKQRAQLRRVMSRAQAILDGSSLPGGGGGADALVCTARDNDNRNPWMLGLRDRVQVQKIRGTVVGAKDLCEKTIDTAVVGRNSALACLARDNDGRSPWIIGRIDLNTATMTKINYTSVSSFETCVSTLNQAKVVRDGMIFCGARDNDGRSPWGDGFRWRRRKC